MEEIKLRNATLDDAPRLVEIYSYYVENTATSLEYGTPSIEKFKMRMNRTQKHYPYLVAEIDGKIIGYAYASMMNWREGCRFAAELTIYLDKNFRRQGAGKKLYGELEKILREQGIKNLYAGVICPDVEDEYANFDSFNFHQHLGFKLCGKFQNMGYKFNRWYNVIWMEKTCQAF